MLRPLPQAAAGRIWSGAGGPEDGAARVQFVDLATRAPELGEDLVGVLTEARGQPVWDASGVAHPYEQVDLAHPPELRMLHLRHPAGTSSRGIVHERVHV